MKIREVLTIIEREEGDHENNHDADNGSRGRYGDLHALIGSKAKETYNAVDLDVISDTDLGSAIIDIVINAYNAKGLPKPSFLAMMYSPDQEGEELEKAKTRSEIRKIDAQAVAVLSQGPPAKYHGG